jgi:hypothetical protein
MTEFTRPNTGIEATGDEEVKYDKQERWRMPMRIFNENSTTAKEALGGYNALERPSLLNQQSRSKASMKLAEKTMASER